MLLPAPPDAAILMLWNIPGALLMGCLFTTFISWIRFPETVSNGGLVSHLIRPTHAPAVAEQTDALRNCTWLEKEMV